MIYILVRFKNGAVKVYRARKDKQVNLDRTMGDDIEYVRWLE